MARSFGNIPKPKGSSLKGNHGVNHTGQPQGHKNVQPPQQRQGTGKGMFKRGKGQLCK